MRILFICPKISQSYSDHITAIAHKGWPGATFAKRDLKRHERYSGRVFYGLGLLTVASSLPQEISWVFVDENLDRQDLEHLYQRSDFDLVAVTGQVIQRERILELIQFFTDRGTHVVVGGVHATTFPDDYVRSGVSVIMGEGEGLFATFLDDFVDHKPKSLYRRERDEEFNLKESPIPNYSAIGHCRYNLIGVQTTRGCPYRCNYCSVSNILGEKYRHKPVEQVKEEVIRVKKLWPDSMFYFFDDNLVGDREYVLNLFEGLKDIPLGKWGVHADFSISQDRELLEMITSNGSPYLAIGFETLSGKNVLTLGNKMKASLFRRYDEGVVRLQQYGIEVGGSFMFGFPGDSKKELDAIATFINKHKIRGFITRYSVIPGSQLYNETLAEYEIQNGLIKEKGTPQARIINEFFMSQNGFQYWDTEDMIIKTLRQRQVTELPMSQIDALAVFRCFFS